MLTNEQVRKFQKIYEARFNEKIGFEDAYEMGAGLVRLMKIIYRPISEAEFRQLQKRRRDELRAAGYKY